MMHHIPLCYCRMLLSGTGSAAGPLDGKNVDASIPRYLMEPKWAAREGREAAAHSLAQPFLVPLEANGLKIPSADVTPLGEYAPKTPQVPPLLALWSAHVHAYTDSWSRVPAISAAVAKH